MLTELFISICCLCNQLNAWLCWGGAVFCEDEMCLYSYVAGVSGCFALKGLACYFKRAAAEGCVS